MSDWRKATRRVLAAIAVAATGLVVVGGTASASDPVSVTGIAPHQLAAGATRTFTITGAGFQPGAVIAVSGGGFSVAHTKVTSATQLTTSLHAASGAALGARSVTITVLSHSGTLAGSLLVASPPTLVSILPGQVARSGHERRLTLTGTHFEHGMRVRLGAGRILHVTVSSATTATLVASFPHSTSIGAHDVTVTNPDGGVAHDVAALTVDAVPAITSTSVTTLNQDETTTETITGSGFLPGVTVSIGPGITATVTAVSPTHVVATLRASARTTVGRRTITVTNTDGGTAARRRALVVDYAPIFTKWAVGDGAVAWPTSLGRPVFATVPTLSFSGAGVTVASMARSARGELSVHLTIASAASPTWRTMTLTEGARTWVVPRALKVRLPPTITRFPSLKQEATFTTVKVRGAHFEVCARKDPVVTISGTGVTVNMASTALGDLMYVNVTVSPTAPVGARDVTMTNCDSGGTATSIGVFTVIAG